VKMHPAIPASIKIRPAVLAVGTPGGN